MIIDLNLDVKELNPAIFSKGNDPKNYTTEEIKEIEAYGIAFTEWDKTKIGEAPKMPSFNFTPFQASISLMKRAIFESHKVGNMGHLRHVIRLVKDIDDQDKPESKTLILPQPDVQFIKKQFNKVEFPTQPVDLVKFVVMVSDALENAKEK